MSTYPDNKNPFDEGQAKARNGSISAGGWCRQTEGQEEADPVEEECHFNEKDNILRHNTYCHHQMLDNFNQECLIVKSSNWLLHILLVHLLQENKLV